MSYSNQTDTIAAIATGLTESGIGIIRISGPNSYEIIQKLFVNGKGNLPSLEHSHRVHHGFVKNNVSRETLDEVLMLNMRGPHTYTGEDTVEIDCHGGVLMMRRILESVLQAGARIAEPGEFTKRAFLNGRIDLSQAEAVIDLIEAKNDRALKASLAQLKGSVSEAVKACRAAILEDTAYIEAALDDPEHISLDGFSEKLRADVEDVQAKLKRLISSAEEGKLLREGIYTVILGKPNAGKSSLLNALLQEDRAIVTNIAGTTRDTLEAGIQLRGLNLNVVDTAGIRETGDEIERMGVERALQAAERADLLIYVVDRSRPLDESDQQILAFLRKSGKRCIVLMNKSDLESCVDEAQLRNLLQANEEGAADGNTQGVTSGEVESFDTTKQPIAFLPISAKEGEGLEALGDEVERLFLQGKLHWNDEVWITSLRQKEELMDAEKSLREVLHSLDLGIAEDFYTIDLMEAYRTLGLIVGEEADEDLINEIFSKFCMGK